MRCWVPLGAAGHICANFATCYWEPLTMLNPQFVAGEHGLFGGHKSEDVRTFLFLILFFSCHYILFFKKKGEKKNVDFSKLCAVLTF